MYLEVGEKDEDFLGLGDVTGGDGGVVYEAEDVGVLEGLQQPHLMMSHLTTNPQLVKRNSSNVHLYKIIVIRRQCNNKIS